MNDQAARPGLHGQACQGEKQLELLRLWAVKVHGAERVQVTSTVARKPSTEVMLSDSVNQISMSVLLGAL